MPYPLGRVSVLAGVTFSLLAVLFTTSILWTLHDRINPTAVALVELLVIVLIARVFEWRAALAASVVASLAFNYLFLPPYYTFTIAAPDNWVAFVVFVSVAATVGHLASMSNRRREEAERLLGELEDAFDRASEAEGLKRSEKLKTALLDAVTHDFRTPLTSIKASVTMLIEDEQFRKSGLDRHARTELLEVINEETDRLNSFVESMVEAARYKAGGDVLKFSPTTADEVILKAAQRAKAHKQTHRLRSQIQSGLPQVMVDSRAIVEALFNLIQNAASYAPAGTEITIGAIRHNGDVRFSIEDEGPGVSESEREAVFERFYRGKTDEKRERGMGMGLAIVRGIIEAHGGNIWVEQGKKGARFVFDLPADPNGQ
jgi:two-component system sensor histidine kinase KdpD